MGGSDYYRFWGKEKLNFEKLAGFCWMTTYPLNLSTSPTNWTIPGLVRNWSSMEFFQKYLKSVKDFERGEIQIIDNTELHKVMEESLQAPPESKTVPEPEKKDLSFWRESWQKAA